MILRSKRRAADFDGTRLIDADPHGIRPPNDGLRPTSLETSPEAAPADYDDHVLDRRAEAEGGTLALGVLRAVQAGGRGRTDGVPLDWRMARRRTCSAARSAASSRWPHRWVTDPRARSAWRSPAMAGCRRPRRRGSKACARSDNASGNNRTSNTSNPAPVVRWQSHGGWADRGIESWPAQ